MKLILVNVFHRHGERAALKLYQAPIGQLPLCSTDTIYLQKTPSNPPTKFSKLKNWLKTTFSPNSQTEIFNFRLIYNKNSECAAGQLTDIGKKTLYDLGQKLRRDYVDSNFVKSYYDSREVHLMSTEFPRTIQSLQNLVKGLFTTKNEPIDIHLLKKDVICEYSQRSCKNFLAESQNFKEKVLNENAQEIKKVQSYFKKFCSSINIQVTDNPGIYEIFDIVMSSRGNKQKYFLNFCDKQLRIAERISLDLFFRILNKTHNLMMYRGAVIRDLHDRIKEKIHDLSSGKKMYVFSGHDTTIYPLLLAFGLQDNRWPTFGAFLVFETLLGPDGRYYVRAKYNGRVIEFKKGKQFLDKQRTLMSVDDFFKICKKFSIEEREQQCEIY